MPCEFFLNDPYFTVVFPMIALYFSHWRLYTPLTKTGSQIIVIGLKNYTSIHVHGRALKSKFTLAINIFSGKRKKVLQIIVFLKWNTFV